MKKLLRPLTALITAVMLVSCVSPYQAQMQAVHNAYTTGNMSESEYRQRMNDLSIADAGWQQQNANDTAAVAAVGIAALGIAAIADDHHHHGYYNGYHGYHGHHGHWH